MGREVSINVKGSHERLHNNVKVNVREWTKADKMKSVDALNNARALALKFGQEGEQSIAFFRKCFNRLGLAKTWDIYEYTMSRKDQEIRTSRIRYFIGTAKQQPEMQ